MGSEVRLQELCEDGIRSYLDTNGFEAIQTGQETKIIKDCTFVPEEDSFTLYLGHAEADVVLYKTADGITEVLNEGDSLKLYQNSANEVRIPLVVLEVKNGSSSTPTTDAIRSRTIIAREMNEIFPFLGYFFVGDEMSLNRRKIFRAGKHFTSFFISDEPADKDWIRDELIDEGIEPHLQKLKYLGML
jgi:hypothetical protein